MSKSVRGQALETMVIVRESFTPDVVDFQTGNQYGLLKMIVINKKGTFVDGLKISNVTINEFNLDYKSTVRFKFEIEEDAKMLVELLFLEVNLVTIIRTLKYGLRIVQWK